MAKSHSLFLKDMELKELRNLIEKKVNESGYTLEEFSYAHANGQDTLTLVVDKDTDIDMNMIVELTNNVNAYLDEINPFENPYTLDLSSLGAEKPLKVNNLAPYVGKYVNVHMINPIKGENIYEGELKEVNDENIVIVYRNKTRSIPLEILKSNIYKIRLAIKF